MKRIESTDRVVGNALKACNEYGGPLFKCKACGSSGSPYDGFCRSCGHILDKQDMFQRAEELIRRELRKTTHSPIRGLAYVRGIGRIDLEVGKKGVPPGYDYGTGLSKILKKHKEQIKDMAATLVLGKTFSPEDESKIARVHGDNLSILGKRKSGAHVITHYKDAKKAASFEGRR